MAAAEEPAGTTGRLFQGVARNEFGFRMLQSMGWSEGKGLGASGTGITKHIAAVKRQDSIGIGADLGADSSAKVDFSANTHNFDAILAGLQSVGAAEPRKSKKKDKKKDKKRDKKDKKAEKLRVAAPPARGRPQGRYAKREAGKMVKGYSQEDLSMILGVAPGAFVAPPAVERAASPAGGGSSDDEGARKSRSKKKRRRERDAEPAAADADDGAAAEPAAAPAAAAAAAAAAKATAKAAAAAAAAAVEPEESEEEEEEGYAAPPPDWWGARTFRWAGRLGGIRRSKRRADGFDEDDQVAAFNAVHDGATQGKRGLGIRDAPKKVAGARWAGSKTRFGDDAAEDAEADADADAIAEQQRQDEAVAHAAAEAAPAEKGGARKIKWKKLAERALKALPGGAATLSVLRYTVFAAAGVADHHEHAEELTRRLHGSSRFAVEGDSVRLVAGLDDGEDD